MLLRQRMSKSTVQARLLCSLYLLRFGVVHISPVYTPLLTVSLNHLCDLSRGNEYFIFSSYSRMKNLYLKINNGSSSKFH